MLRIAFSAFTLAACLAVQPLMAQSGQPASNARATKPAPVINLNTATQAELETLPGIGARVAARIIEYREKKGPFKKIEELMNVQGIGEKSFLKLRAQLTLGPKSDTAGQQ
jgi:comEA protein